MSDFEAEYEQLMDEAQRRAQAQGRGDVADYLNLRAANDRLRTLGIEWLLQTFMNLAGEANRAGAGLVLARR